MAKGRVCNESCIEYLLAELSRHYAQQKDGPPGPAAIEAIGFRVGRQLVERYAKDKSRMSEHLEIIKFICKDFWAEVFRKQVDNLRTNHRGIFVLKDANFRWLLKLSTSPDAAVPLTDVARDQLIFPCALVRGALCHLGVDAIVTADPSHLPAVDFTVYIKQR